MCCKGRGQPNMQWLAIHYPNWLLQYQSYHQGLAPAQPVALYCRQSSQLLSVSDSAVEVGLKPGQSVATAQALSSDLQLIAYEVAMSIEAADWLCHWSYDYSARVVPLTCQHHSNLGMDLHVPDTLLLEVGSMARVFSGLPQLLEQYATQAQEYSLQWQLALGDNPLGTALLAHSAPHYVAPQSDEKPDASYFQAAQQLATGHHIKALAALPVNVLPIALELQLACENMGLTHLESLFALPRAELGERFGDELLQLLAKLTGQLPQPLAFYEPPECYQHKLILSYEVEHIEGLLFPLGRMLSELASYLLRHQRAVLCLRLNFEYRDKALVPLMLTINYPFAEHRSDGLLKLCRLQLERIVLSSPVVSIALQLQESVVLTFTPSEWWQGNTQDEGSTRLLATLVAKLGHESVKGIACVAARLPEASWQSQPLALGRSETLCAESRASYQGKTVAIKQQRQRAGQVVKGIHDGRFRPTWLLKQAEPIALTDVRLLKGPERIASDWHAVGTQRDYYIAQHKDGGLCWVYREVNGIFLHGWFS